MFDMNLQENLVPEIGTKILNQNLSNMGVSLSKHGGLSNRGGVCLNIPKTELAMRGSNGIGKGRALVVHFHQKKRAVLGDACSRLASTKQQVASSNINI